MRLGLIARCDQSGLATQTHEFYRSMQPAKALVIDVGHLYNETTHCNKKSFPERYPGAMVQTGWSPPSHVLANFIEGLDVVFTAETTYSRELIPLARQRGVRVVVQPNWEFLDLTQQPDLWAVPSLWHYDDIPQPKTYLPVPIALDRFAKRRDSAVNGTRHFLHVVGRPAVHDRNGTPQLLDALRYIRSDIKLTLKCQDAGYLKRLLQAAHEVPDNVEIATDSSDVENYWDLYEGDVLVMPRKFGGLCLPVNEALGAGMPVIMPNIKPNNTWLPSEWLVPANKTDSFRAHQDVDVFTVDARALAHKMDQFTDPEFLHRARREAQTLATALSWDTLRPVYEQVLTNDVCPAA